MSASEEMKKVLAGKTLVPQQWEVPSPKIWDDGSHLEHIRKAAQERTEREETLALAAAQSLNAAVECVQVLMQQIDEFQLKLTDTEEVALYIIGGPSGRSFFPTSILAINPDKVVFKELDSDSRPFTVIQHVSQLNFAMQVAIVAKDEKPRRIGFMHTDDA